MFIWWNFRYTFNILKVLLREYSWIIGLGGWSLNYFKLFFGWPFGYSHISFISSTQLTYKTPQTSSLAWTIFTRIWLHSPPGAKSNLSYIKSKAVVSISVDLKLRKALLISFKFIKYTHNSLCKWRKGINLPLSDSLA